MHSFMGMVEFGQDNILFVHVQASLIFAKEQPDDRRCVKHFDFILAAVKLFFKQVEKKFSVSWLAGWLAGWLATAAAAAIQFSSVQFSSVQLNSLDRFVIIFIWNTSEGRSSELADRELWEKASVEKVLFCIKRYVANETTPRMIVLKCGPFYLSIHHNNALDAILVVAQKFCFFNVSLLLLLAALAQCKYHRCCRQLDSSCRSLRRHS
ncbi:hypothetical protein T4B_5441 [Trichinella pseudospiralis]|uniref:Uncharacterized protein n=1 Tax=Trichinella pseudospiralis TaxID=6337 RepID=A0A0V1I5X9_TRIPS|nr:hypothetical protein T4B_5441 [Trichinella pseudospiralis]